MCQFSEIRADLRVLKWGQGVRLGAVVAGRMVSSAIFAAGIALAMPGQAQAQDAPSDYEMHVFYCYGSFTTALEVIYGNPPKPQECHAYTPGLAKACAAVERDFNLQISRQQRLRLYVLLHMDGLGSVIALQRGVDDAKLLLSHIDDPSVSGCLRRCSPSNDACSRACVASVSPEAAEARDRLGACKSVTDFLPF